MKKYFAASILLALFFAGYSQGSERAKGKEHAYKRDRYGYGHDCKAKGRTEGSDQYKLMSKLNLSAEQKDLWKNLKFTLRKSAAENKDQLRLHGAKLKIAITDSQEDSEKINDLVAEMNRLRGLNFALLVDHIQKSRKILDDQQIVIFDESIPIFLNRRK